ncbi:helix-turn-helix transcriptional regulator [Schlesneria paludicola]|uniref:helix-turn-helix transcriptional regulator n=1 Tax=Schlesneria paludicola TaxID=360056 RepID=UPI00029ABF7E|nr:YafY family protein [Schlesneria paludicola]
MGKTERLFGVMDALRRHRRPITAADLAAEQGVSVRTLYRDVQALISLGAPIDGEAGIGYMLRPGFFLPPLMFGREELEALVLGIQWVGAQPDDKLAEAAKNALGKIAAASPPDLRELIDDTGLMPVLTRKRKPLPALALIRQSMRLEKALMMQYDDEAGRASERHIWPVQLAYFEGKQIVAAWCCMREAFRHFRTDRITGLILTESRFGKARKTLVREWRTEQAREYANCQSSPEGKSADTDCQ